MLEIVSIGVAIMGIVAFLTGILRNKEKYAEKLAKKVNLAVGDEHRTKAKQNNIVMMILGIILLGIGGYNLYLIHFT